MKYALIPAVALVLLSSPAEAASQPDLDVSIVAPAGTSVYQSASYDVVVSNIGNRHARNVTLTIDLPQTNTSPNVYILGDLGSYSSRCSLSGQSLVCSLGRVRRNRSKTVSFDIALPLSSAAITIDAAATTTTQPETNPNNNSDSYSANLAIFPYAISAPQTGTTRHCTGQSLTSFFECETAPSSISSFDAVFEVGGSMSFIGAPTYTGSWTQPASDRLQYQVIYQGNVVADFDGYGVGGNCFEGVTTFQTPQYVSLYEVCF